MQAPLQANEHSRQVLDYIRAHEAPLLQFARDLVATPSPTPPGDERAVAARIVGELEKLGLGSPEVIAGKPERPNLLLRLGSGRPGRSLILNGHIDTKPAGEVAQWRTPPFDPVIKDGFLYGLGSTDMKGAVAAMVYATAALAKVRPALAGELQLLLTADEEGGSGWGAKYLAEHGHLKADAALIGEPSGIRRELEYVDLDSRGILCVRFRVHGDQMHSSLSDEFKAVNASVKAAELLLDFRSFFQRPGMTVNAGVTLQGGVYFGVVPGTAEFGCDVRVPVGTCETTMRTEVEEWLQTRQRQDPDLRVQSVWETPPSTWIPPVHFPADHPLAVSLIEASRCILPDLPAVGCFPGATDAPWFVAAGVPTIPSFGPGLLPLAHSPNECVRVSSILDCARIYALCALGYLAAKLP
ncbi:MAG: M20/M25/M40 family metallo-hydrolase [Verrucomicrobiota bacterium]